MIGRGPALELLLTGRQVTPDEAQRARASSAALFADEDGVRRARRAARRRPAAGDRRDQALRPRGRASVRSSDGLDARARAHRAAVPLAGRQRGPDRVRREARAGVRGRMSTTAQADRVERGAFVDGAVEPIGGDDADDHRTRRPARSVGRVTSVVGRDGRPRRALGAGGASARGRAAPSPTAAPSCTPAPRRCSTHVDELAPGLVAEQGKTLREAQARAAQGGRHARALRRAGQAGARDRGPRPRPRRRGPRAAPAARRRRGDRAVELPDDAAVQQARPGAAVRQHGGGQARRHDAVHDAAPRRDPHRGGPAARRAQRRARAPARSPARRSSRHPLVRKVAFTGSTPTGRARRRAGREGHQARDARARRLGPDDHLRRRRPGEGGERGEHGALLQLRPGVPGDQARLRLRRGRRRGHRGDRGQGAAAARRHRHRRAASRSARCTPSASARCSRTRSRAR